MIRLKIKEEMLREWQEKEVEAKRKMEAARAKQTVKKWSRERQVCGMNIRELEREIKKLKEAKVKKVYGYRRCLFCKETIFTGQALRRKFGKRKRYFCSRNHLVEYLIDRINRIVLKDVKSWELLLEMDDYLANRNNLKNSIDESIKENYETVFIKETK